MISRWVALKIVDKKPYFAVILHPHQHVYELVICEMMTEKRIENNIRIVPVEVDIFVI